MRRAARAAELEALREGRKPRSARFRSAKSYRRKSKHPQESTR